MPELDSGAAPAAASEPSLRDSLSAAFNRPEEENTPPVAEAQTGEQQTNQTETQPETGSRERDEHGRFKPKATEAAAPPVEGKPPAEKPATETPAEPQAEAQAAPGGPPPGWSPAAKAAFNELPDAVKQSVIKREDEINRGFAKLRDYKELDPYVEMARQSGITLPQALDRYVEAEKLLERDPVSGLKWLCQNYNVDPRQLLGEAAPQAQTPTAQQQQTAPFDLRQHLAPVLQEINTLKQTVLGERQAKTQAQVEAFFSDPKNIYAENVADQMAMLIQNAKMRGQEITLQQAYDDACWMNSEIRDLLIKKQAHDKAASEAAKLKLTANQARQAGQSITGGPAATPPPATSDPTNLRSFLEQQFAGVRT